MYFNLKNQKLLTTASIQSKIQKEVLQASISLIYQLQATGTTLDYLVVVTLSGTNDHTQRLKITCERPQVDISVELELDVLNLKYPLNTTFWVIDDFEYQTILFPEEY